MGSSFHTIHYDEVAFINYNDIVISTATNTMLRTSEQARKAGLPSSIIYSTTAGNPDTKPGAFALSIVQDALPFTENYYDLNGPEELDKIIKQSGTSNVLYLEFSYRQLGKTDQWFKEACERSHSSPDDIARDLLNIWQAATDKAIIPQNLLQKMRASKRDPNFVDLQDGFVVRWYIDKAIVEDEDFKTRPLIMGMDTSENVGRDFTVFILVDPRDMRVLATCKTNDSNTMQIARHVYTLMTRYQGIMWIPERNNTGTAIIDFVLEQMQRNNINPYLRIYNEVIQQMGEPKYKNVNVSDYKEIHGSVRSAFGYRTAGAGSSTARNNLYKVTMMKALELCHDRLYDGTLISEFCNLTERNGRVDHPDGCHDDHCFIGSELIWTKQGQIPISELKLGDLVLTRKGYRPVIRLFKRQAEVITKFGITGTPDHPFITPNGIVRFKDLTKDTKVFVCLDGKQSSIIVTDISQMNQEKQLDKVSKCVETVYNVTVADCHEYFVNGILVHNCISFLLAMWAIFFGKNLRMYGIPENIVLQSVSPTGQTISETDRAEQLTIRRRIAQLEDALSATPSSVLRESYLRELNNLKPLVNEDLISVAPMAISQVRHEEEQISQYTSSSAEARLRGFLNRWRNT